MTIIKHEDMRAIDYCNRGARKFCERHGINWWSFLQHGVDAATVEHVDDEMLQQVIAQAKAREAREKGLK